MQWYESKSVVPLRQTNIDQQRSQSLGLFVLRPPEVAVPINCKYILEMRSYIYPEGS